MYVIRYPRVGQPTPVIKSKFVASGAAPPGARNLVGSLLDAAGQHVVLARTVREPKGALEKNWLMVFDLTGVPYDPRTTFTVVISQLVVSTQLKLVEKIKSG